MYDYMIVDGNGIFHAAQATRPLSVEGIGDVQAVYNSLQKLRALLNERPARKVLWLWDGHAQFRYDMFPEYKGARHVSPEAEGLSPSERKQAKERAEKREVMSDVKPYLEQLLTHLGVDQVVAPNFEADDVAGYLVRKISKAGRTALLVTGDADWQQLVCKGVDWLDPRKFGDDKPLTVDRFEEVTGYASATQFLQAKAMLGDKSDSIPTMPKFGAKKVLAVFREFDGVKSLILAHKSKGAFTKTNSGFTTAEANAINKYIEEWMPQFQLNLGLMNLISNKYDEDIRGELVKTLGKRDPHEFEYLCRTLRFMSVIRNLEHWYTVFSVKKEEKAA